MLNLSQNQTPYQQYKRSAVETSTPEKLLLMLFDGAIRFINQGKVAISEKRFDDANTLLLKVQDIFSELMKTLDMEKGGDIAKNLIELYAFYQKEVIQANMKKDIARLEPVLEFFQTFRSAWAETANLARVGA